MPEVVRYQVSRGDADCALVALSIYLQRSYEDVFGVAVAVARTTAPHRQRGLFIREIKQIAKLFGQRLHERKTFDLDEDEGILRLDTPDSDAEHAAFIKHGLVWDTDGTVWEMDTYLEATKYRPVSLLQLHTAA
jgi:trans-2-enoyl-CoA reductase